MNETVICEDAIRELCSRCSIPMVGFIGPEPLISALSRLEQRQRINATPFVKISPKTRIDYTKVFPEVKSVIVIGIPYYYCVPKPKDMQKRGELSIHTWSTDYHLTVKNKLNTLAEALKNSFGEINYQIYVDNPKLVDREAAYCAGLGFYGKNNTLVNPVYGSYFSIGQLLIDRKIEFEKAVPMANGCSNCNKCLAACPGNALGNGYDLVAERCISYITQKKQLNADQEDMMHSSLYGCDICQSVCPYNSELKETESDFDIETIYPYLDAILAMDRDSFRLRYGKSALYWRGLEIIKRNAGLVKKSKNKR